MPSQNGSIKIRLGLDNVDEAIASEYLLKAYDAVDIDVDPEGGVLDPLTLQPVGHSHLTARLHPQFFAQFIEDWWLRSGHAGSAVDLSGPIAIVTRSSLLHTIRDLDDGLITLGAEGAVGFGWAHVPEVYWQGDAMSLNRIPDVPIGASAS